MQFALNHMTVPGLGYGAFLDLAARLGCVGVEVRNDLSGALFDGLDPAMAGRMAADRGLRLVGVSQVYPFTDWNAARAEEVRALARTARAAGAETVSLIPRNDGIDTGTAIRGENLRRALTGALPILRETGMRALVEPLGFDRSALRLKSELAAMIDALGAWAQFGLVHDTFHHALVTDGGPAMASPADPVLPARTGIIHISGVADPGLGFARMEDAHRVLVDDRDRLENIAQIADLRRGGCDAVISMECFAPQVHALKDPYRQIRRSFEFIFAQLGADAA